MMRPQTTSAVESAGTWKEMVCAIDKERRTLPWQPSEAPVPVRVPMLERKTEERSLDPVLMRFRDPLREEDHAARTALRTRTLPLQRLDHLRKTVFNIVSHEGPPRKMESMAPHLITKQPLGQREWHLLSHLRQDKHTTCPILFDAQYMTAHVVPTSGVQLPENRSSQPRPFNIINNRFAQNHDKNLEREYDTMKTTMVKKYWETHKFDVIKAEHYSDADEEACRHREAQASRTHGQAFLSKLPQSFKYAEGNSYDILTTAVKDPELIKVALKRDSKKHNRLTKFHHLTGEQRAAGEAEYALWERRRLARVSFKRWEAELDRGFDFIKPEVQVVPGTEKNPLPRRDPSLWKRVSTSLSNNSMSTSAPHAASHHQQQQQQQQQQQSHDILNETSQGSFHTSSSGNWAPDTGRFSARAGTAVGRAPTSARAATTSAAGSGSLSRVPSLDMKVVAAVRTGGLSEYAL